MPEGSELTSAGKPQPDSEGRHTYLNDLVRIDFGKALPGVHLTSYTGLVSREVASAAGPVSTVAGAARRSDRRPGQTIRKVLDAGLEELRESSYANLTMRAVASRAGVSPASAYTYFPSKSALVAAVYLRFLRDLPLHTDVNDSTKTRVSATMRDMAVVVADEPELTTACGAALMADEPAVKPLREQIGEEVSRRIGAALGPGWPRAVKSTLQMTFAGALMTARFVSYDEIAGQLDEAVNLILGASVA
jgi:TetR/AcrR family transcriptional regulator, cholesterol catabolism regulator